MLGVNLSQYPGHICQFILGISQETVVASIYTAPCIMPKPESQALPEGLDAWLLRVGYCTPVERQDWI